MQKISIITISYNSKNTIERTIKSVLEQNYPNLEYIIIDGGSTDKTIDIIEKYRNKINKIIIESDEGISDAFNKGIQVATGDIIGILNSDDWYEKNTLEIVNQNLSNDNYDFIVGSLRYWNSKGHNFIVKPDKNYKSKIRYKMPHLNHPASFFKKSVYGEVGLFNKNFKYAMDYDFFFRVNKANKKPAFTDKILANMSFSGASDKNAIKAYKEVLKISDKKLTAFLYFLYSAIKYYIRFLLIKTHLEKLLLKIRKRKYKNENSH
jgi:glycosyltransferase involved in cell wall biosynthesis